MRRVLSVISGLPIALCIMLYGCEAVGLYTEGEVVAVDWLPTLVASLAYFSAALVTVFRLDNRWHVVWHGVVLCTGLGCNVLLAARSAGSIAALSPGSGFIFWFVVVFLSLCSSQAGIHVLALRAKILQSTIAGRSKAGD